MGRPIEEAISYEATRRASGFKVEPALTEPPECLGWTRGQWDTLSEGYKREIERDLRRQGKIPDLCSAAPQKKSVKEIREEVEYAARKRL